VTKDELLAAIKRDRATLESLMARVGDGRMLEPALEGGWSVKDALAHITAWEQRCMGWIRENGADKPPSFTEEGINAYNAEVYEANKDRALQEIVAESKRSFGEMVEAVAGLADDVVTAPPAWAPAIPLDRIIDANSAEHYREHIDQLTRWLDGAGG
jgi:hypothetical protein